VPASVEYSILTSPTAPPDRHNMLCAEPTAHFSPPFGAVTTRIGSFEIEKTASLESTGSPVAVSETLTRQLSETSSGTAQR
jgi:hypothetical protein